MKRHVDSVGRQLLTPAGAQTFTIDVQPAAPLHNRVIAADVNGDGNVAGDDVIDIINFINVHGSGPVPPAKPGDPPPAFFYDVTADNCIAAGDVVTIINYINAHQDVQKEAVVQTNYDSTDANEALLSLLAADTSAQSKRQRA